MSPNPPIGLAGHHAQDCLPNEPQGGGRYDAAMSMTRSHALPAFHVRRLMSNERQDGIGFPPFWGGGGGPLDLLGEGGGERASWSVRNDASPPFHSGPFR